MKTKLGHRPGCYGDGRLGHQHTRQLCASMLVYVWSKVDIDQPTDIINELCREMSDDASEEQDACDWLNEHDPLENHYWGWYQGDFGLWPAEEDL